MSAKCSIILGDAVSQKKFGPWDSISRWDVLPPHTMGANICNPGGCLVPYGNCKEYGKALYKYEFAKNIHLLFQGTLSNILTENV